MTITTMTMTITMSLLLDKCARLLRGLLVKTSNDNDNTKQHKQQWQEQQ